MTATQVASVGSDYHVRVWSEGTGRPLLFLHGFDAFPGEADYLTRLAANRRVIAPEHPGYGESTGFEHIDDIFDMTLYYRRFVESLGIDKIDVIGHSLGGMFAAELAAICPELVRRLVLVAPFGLWLEESPIPDLFYMGVSQLQRATWHEPESYASQQALNRMSAGVSAQEAAIARSGNLAIAGKFLWPIPDRGLAKRLPLIKAPTLVMLGASDKLISRPYGEAFAAAIPDARLEVVNNAGHHPMLEQPDEFIRLVDGFLDG